MKQGSDEPAAAKGRREGQLGGSGHAPVVGNKRGGCEREKRGKNRSRRSLVPSCYFFSSRRRHTRLQGDWSSDVCSSDLASAGDRALRRQLLRPRRGTREGSSRPAPVAVAVRRARVRLDRERRGTAARRLHRSEERRVGKECRSRWSPYH